MDHKQRLLQRLWNEWELRILVLVSLLLQIILISAANLRKHSSLPMVKGVLWIAYLLADLVATYSLGILSRSQSARDKNVDVSDSDMELMALWAPFLLLHLGGPDVITAFSLEDNQLWLRHGLGLVVQVAMAVNILFRYFPEGALLVPSVLVFVCGVLKYCERTWALKYGSMNDLRKSMLGEPDPGPDFANTMGGYVAKLRSGMPAPINVSQERQGVRRGSPNHRAPPDDEADDAKTMRRAYKFFVKFKGLFVDSIFSYKDRADSRAFFLYATPESAFKVVDMELSFAYDVLFTKAVVSRAVPGILIRAFSLPATMVAALYFFVVVVKSKSKQYIPEHLYITATLFVGAVLIEITSLARLLFSEWTVIHLDPSRGGVCRCLRRWMVGKRFRWSNTMSQYNLLNFCLKQRRIRWANKVLDVLGCKEMWDSYWYMRHADVRGDMREFVVKELKNRSTRAHDSGNYNLFTRCRGEQVIEEAGYRQELGWSVRDEFDECLIMWHIATDLCYRADRVPAEAALTPDYRRMAMEFSSYLLYLLAERPLMLSATAVVGVKRYEDTCAEVVGFFKDEPPDMNGLNAYRTLMSINTDLRPTQVKGDRSKSVLWDGCRLAQDLLRFPGEIRWEMMCKVMFEMVCYAAIRCRGFYHAQQLSQGGELLTFVWFLIAHMGMGEQYMIETGAAVAEVAEDEGREGVHHSSQDSTV